jgi:hypothetical protein
MDGKVGLRDITLPAIGHHYQTEICKKKKLVPYGKAYLFSGEGQTDEVHEAARAIL